MNGQSNISIYNCPGCLKTGYHGFCNVCLKKLFNSKVVSPILPFTRPEFALYKLEHGLKLSISGVQIKHSVKLENKKLVLTESKGEYILKPIPLSLFDNATAIPANEHFTMQLASQIFNIPTAANAIVFFADEQPAYLTKRFDVLPDGKRLLQEDFAQISGATEETNGANYKYDSTYENIAELIKRYVKAYRIEMEKFFKLLLFNYIICNGDAHLKNFSLFRNEEYGDYLLTPAYDLMNTSLHIKQETDTALELFKDVYMTESFKAGSKYTRIDFFEFGLRIGLIKKRINRILDEFIGNKTSTINFIHNSFLPDDLKEKYMNSMGARIRRLES